MSRPPQSITCRRCGFALTWTPTTRHRPPLYCTDCRGLPRPMLDYTLAARAVEYRLAIEMASALLRMGRTVEALDVLDRHEAPARAGVAYRRTA